MVFTDTHTHLYSEEFDPDLPQVIERALDAGVTRLYLPAIDSQYHGRMLSLVEKFPDTCYPMMGLHPTSVKENFRDELAIVAGFLADRSLHFHAIGEIGIDLYWDKTFMDSQIEAFGFQLDLALQHDLPVVIHTRNSMDITLGLLEERRTQGLRGIFHCFSGNRDHARRAVSLGFLLGIGGVATYKNSGLQDVIAETGLEHLVLETDAPWLTPVPHRGKRNEPAYIPLIAAKIAEIKNISVEEVAEVTTGSGERVFGVTG